MFYHAVRETIKGIPGGARPEPDPMGRALCDCGTGCLIAASMPSCATMLGRLVRGARNRLSDWVISPAERRRRSRHRLVGPAKLWSMKRDFQVHFLNQMGLCADDTLLDIGCGTLRGGIPLIRLLAPGHYCGVEVREEALNNGRAELAEAKLLDKEPRLVLCDDLGSLQLEQRFRFAWSFSVLIHLNDEALRGCLQLAAAHLEPEGRFFANVNLHDEDEPQPPERSWQGFPVVSRTLRFYEEAARDCGLRLEDLGPLSSLGHHSGMPAHDAQHMLCMRRSL